VALLLVPDSVVPLADVAVSVLAFAFASRDYDESLLAPDRKLGIAHLYIDDNDSTHTANSRNAAQGIFDLCTQQYASIIASFLRNEVSQDNGRLHADTLQHVSKARDAAAGDVEPAGDPKPVELHQAETHLLELLEQALVQEPGPGQEQEPVADVGTALAQAEVALGQEPVAAVGVGNAMAQAEVARGQEQESVQAGPSVVEHS
jgi:hypothetical protein